jgi:hypothetical protein
MFWLKKGFYNFVLFRNKKTPAVSRGFYDIFLKKNYNSISAEGSGILQDILHTVNFILSLFLMKQMCKLFLNRPNKNQNISITLSK